jgi:uncharacterized protein (DUF1810 family)
MEEKEYMGYTPDYIDSLLPNQIFVFGSNTLGYHTGGASGMARKRFGAVWGQPEGIQGQSYAIPVDFGKGNVAPDIKPYIDRFIAYAKAHPENHFLVTRVGCGIAGYTDQEMAEHFREALEMNNVSLPRSFVNALKNEGKLDYDLDRFVKAQADSYGSYHEALKEIKSGHVTGRWMWYIFPQIKGLGHSQKSEYYGISGENEARAFLNHPVLGLRLREITKAFLDLDRYSAYAVLGRPGDVKVQSCMTLFDVISPKEIFAEVLDKYYDGNRCPKTMRRIGIRQARPTMKKLTITKDCRILLEDEEIKMEPIVKAVYLLYLNHPEGIAFKFLPDYRKELSAIYCRIKPMGLNERVIQSIEDVTNPLLNSINEKCSRIKSVFAAVINEVLLNNYIIIGKSGEAKKIDLPRDMVIWEE